MTKMPSYEHCAAYVGDLYMKWQDALRDADIKANQLIEDLRNQISDKIKLIHRLEEDLSKLEIENIRLKNEVGIQGTNNQ
jgi:hypothetical protein